MTWQRPPHEPPPPKQPPEQSPELEQHHQDFANAVMLVGHRFAKESPYRATLTVVNDYRSSGDAGKEALFLAVLAAYVDLRVGKEVGA